MQAGVGYVEDADARGAGRRAAGEALRRAGAGRPGLVLAFASGALDATAFHAGVREAVGPEVPIVGGSATGVITGDGLSYEGASAAVAVLDAGAAPAALAWTGGLERDEHAAGLDLGRALASDPAAAAGSPALLLFYDSIRRPPTAATPPVMNASRPLIAGLAAGLPGCPPVIGAGVLGDYAFSPTWQFSGEGVGQQRAVGVLLGPAVRTEVQVMHGCTPMDGVPHVLTRVEGGVVHEIDGRPAAEVLDGLYGSAAWRTQRPLSRLTFGVRLGPRHHDLGEEGFVNRLITGVMPDGRAVGLFEADLESGAEVLFMLRDPALMVESARRAGEAAVERLRRRGVTPRFALYIDCAGRAGALSQTTSEEAAEVVAVAARHGIPLLGFYSGVEVAPLAGRSRGLDWTGVLLLLGEA